MSMTKHLAAFLNALCYEKEGPAAISTQTRKAILDYVEDNYGNEARTYVASCFDDQHEDPEGDPVPDKERFIVHTLPGEALMDWIHRPTPTNPNGFNRG